MLASEHRGFYEHDRARGRRAVRPEDIQNIARNFACSPEEPRDDAKEDRNNALFRRFPYHIGICST